MPKETRPKPAIALIIEPDGEAREFPRPKTALQLLTALELQEEGALVIRAGKLLTPDRQIWPGDEIRVRPVRSRG